MKKHQYLLIIESSKGYNLWGVFENMVEAMDYADIVISKQSTTKDPILKYHLFDENGTKVTKNIS